MSSADPEFPFQQTEVNFCNIQVRIFIIYADWYTERVEVALMASGKAKTICDTMRTPEELSSDGGSPFESQEYKSFLKNRGIRKRISTAYYPQNNGHVELVVKIAKRILAHNTDNCGRLCKDRVVRPLMTHRNTSVQDLGMSPAIMLYGRIIKDHLLVLRKENKETKGGCDG